MFVAEDILTATNQEGEVGEPSSAITETIQLTGTGIVTAITKLVNKIILKENILGDCKDSFLINCYKGKGDKAEIAVALDS